MKSLKSKLAKNQVLEFSKAINYEGFKKARIYVRIRFDDECGNGYNSFSITANIYSSLNSKLDRYFITGGCIHDEIKKYFHEFSHLIKYHLMSSNEPMHYIANTIYYATNNFVYDFKINSKNDLISDLYLFNVDENFLRDIDKNYFSLSKIFHNFTLDSNFQKYRKEYNIDKRGLYYKYDKFSNILKLKEFLRLHNEKDFRNFDVEIKKGSEYREANLNYARLSAVWMDATLLQLQDKKQLLDRLPKLMLQFKKDIEKIGLVF